MRGGGGPAARRGAPGGAPRRVRRRSTRTIFFFPVEYRVRRSGHNRRDAGQQFERVASHALRLDARCHPLCLRAFLQTVSAFSLAPSPKPMRNPFRGVPPCRSSPTRAPLEGHRNPLAAARARRATEPEGYDLRTLLAYSEDQNLSRLLAGAQARSPSRPGSSWLSSPKSRQNRRSACAASPILAARFGPFQKSRASILPPSSFSTRPCSAFSRSTRSPIPRPRVRSGASPTPFLPSNRRRQPGRQYAALEVARRCRRRSGQRQI